MILIENIWGCEMIDWLYSFREETKRVIERTNQLKRENERLRNETLPIQERPAPLSSL